MPSAAVANPWRWKAVPGLLMLQPSMIDFYHSMSSEGLHSRYFALRRSNTSGLTRNSRIEGRGRRGWL
jgi:hypothetical protein